MKSLTGCKLEPLLLEDLQEYALWFVEEVAEQGIPVNQLDHVYYLGVYVLQRLMGDAWLDRHIVPSAYKRFDYFRASSNINGEQYKNTHRVIRVAETLFNFQNVQGFSRVVKSLKTDHRGIESIVAELEAAALLHAAGIPFIFGESNTGKGADYDVEINYPDGWVAAADIKCKIEGTALSTNTIRQVIGHAQKQLPGDKACFVLMKIPDDWPQCKEFERVLNEGLTYALNRTKRITNVFVWWEEWLQLPDGTWRRMGHMREVANPQANFDPGPVKGLAKLTWNKKGHWVYLAEIVGETVDVPNDGSVARVIEFL